MHVITGSNAVSYDKTKAKDCKQSNNKTPPGLSHEVIDKFIRNYNNYETYKKLIKDIFEKLLNLLDRNKDEELVKRIIVLLNSAVSDADGTEQIPNGEEYFYISAIQKETKYKLKHETTEIRLPYFLLSVLHFMFTEKDADNATPRNNRNQ